LNVVLTSNNNLNITKTLFIPSSQNITQPYWLETEPNQSMFYVGDQRMVGKAENDPSFEATYTANIGGEIFTIRRPVLYKTVDAAKGEIYQPVVVLPELELQFKKTTTLLLNKNKSRAKLNVTVNTKAPFDYEISFDQSGDFITTPYHLTGSAAKRDSSFDITLDEKNDIVYKRWLRASAKNSSRTFSGTHKTIEYDHIPSITYVRPAELNVVPVNIKTRGKKIGYIPGAGDNIPDALEALNFNVTFLDETDLTAGNLKKFDAIIIGIRAYNIYEYLTNKNHILNDYVFNGGNLIVQYIKSNQVGLKRVAIGPYPFSISAGLRVTEENAKVSFLLPQHPLLNYPNKITEADFEGWVQERSTYQVDQSDNHFEFPLGMNDTNEKQSNGSLAIAKYGKGNFAYTSLVLFRQLPAGVPGAYRLLANLIALPKNK
jgi:hypothetical protein